MPQLYRWARLFTKWLGTFTESTWAYTPSTAVTMSSYHFTPVLSVNTSNGTSAAINIRVVDPNGSAIQRRSWVHVWFASAKDAKPSNTANSVAMSTGTVLWRSNIPTWAIGTGTSYSTQFRAPTFGHGVYVAAQVHTGPAVWSSVKLSFASAAFTPWYVYFSSGAESGEWRAIYVEPRYSVGNSRVQEDKLLTIYLAIAAWSPTSPSLTSVAFSGATLIRTHLNLRNYQIVVPSTGSSFIKVRKVGAGAVVLHAYADVAGRAWASSTFSFTA